MRFLACDLVLKISIGPQVTESPLQCMSLSDLFMDSSIKLPPFWHLTRSCCHCLAFERPPWTSAPTWFSKVRAHGAVGAGACAATTFDLSSANDIASSL